MSISDEFRKLQELRDSGVLTEEEFTKAKASVLAAHVSPPVDENAVRARQQLDQFKERFAKVNPYQVRSLICEAEDLLIFVCGKLRFDEFARAASEIDDWNSKSDNGYPKNARLRYWGYAKDELEKLQKRIAGIEIRK